MNQNEIKSVAKTMSKEEFIITYFNKTYEDDTTSLYFYMDNHVYACPSEITGDPPCCDNRACIKCWVEFVNKLYEDIEKTYNPHEFEEKMLKDAVGKTVSESTSKRPKKFNVSELVEAIKSGVLKDEDKVQCTNTKMDIVSIEDIKTEPLISLMCQEPYTLIKDEQPQEPLELTKKYFIGNTEIKEGMKLRIQVEDPYRNKFEHIVTVNKYLDLEDNLAHKILNIDTDSCFFDILEIIKE